MLPVECGGLRADDVAVVRALRGAPGRPAVAVRGPRAAARPAGRAAPPCPCGRSPTARARSGAAIVAWKDRGRLDLTRAFAARPRRARPARSRRRWRRRRRCSSSPAPSTPPRAGAGAPTSSARSPQRVADGLRARGVPAPLAPVLVRRRGGDQVGLGARDRCAQPRRARPGTGRAGRRGSPGRRSLARRRRADHGRDVRGVPRGARAARGAGRRRR